MKRAGVSITEDKVMADLEEVRRAALQAGAFAPAIRSIELQGRHIGMWKSGTDAPPLSLLDLFALMPSVKKEQE
jgi:hypothetical protein